MLISNYSFLCWFLLKKPTRPGSETSSAFHARSAVRWSVNIIGSAAVTCMLSAPAQAALVNCQAPRPNATSVIYLYYPNPQDDNFDFVINNLPPQLTIDTSPLHVFDIGDLDPSMKDNSGNSASTDQLRNAITKRVKIDFCEFDVRVEEILIPLTPTTIPTGRWQIVGIGSDDDPNVGDSDPPVGTYFGISSYTIANDTGDGNPQDYARIWAGRFAASADFQASGVLVGPDNSTVARWANAIAGTASHEAGHNYGLDVTHSTSELSPPEPLRTKHLMASTKSGEGDLLPADRVLDRYFSDRSYEILARNVGLYQQTVSNWDFTNPNNSTAEGLGIKVLVLVADGAPVKTSMYKGTSSPWRNVEITKDGATPCETINSAQYDCYWIKFTEPQIWGLGDIHPAGQIPAGTEFHVGVGLDKNYIVRDAELRLLDETPMDLHPRVVGYTTGGSFNPATGDFHVTFSNADPEAGPLQISDVRIMHLPRTVSIEHMVKGGKPIGDDDRPIRPWTELEPGPEVLEVAGRANLTLGNLANGRAVDTILTPDPKGRRGRTGRWPGGDPDSKEPSEVCNTGHQLGLFPSARIYVQATVTDPNARHFDAALGQFVTGPLSSRLFFQLPGVTPDLNHNGVDDAIDARRGELLDANKDCSPDQPPERRFALNARLGVALPHASSLDPGPSGHLGLEYYLTSNTSIEGIASYQTFDAGTPGPDLDILQLSVNARTYLPLPGRWKSFLNAGAGAYFLDPGSTVFGYNVGGGFVYELRSDLAIEGAFNLHDVDPGGGAADFSSVQIGLKWRF